MKKYLIHISVIILLGLTGCKSGQEATLIKEPEIRIYQTYDEEKDALYVADYNELDVETLKALYYNQFDYVIAEEDFRKSIQIQSNEDIIVTFDPVVDSVSLNNSYIVLIRDQYVKAVATNPTKYVIPKSFNIDEIISLNEQEKINKNLLREMSKKGKAKIVQSDLYFDTQRRGKLIYTVKVDIVTSEYSYGEIAVYDGFSGELID